jgi:hypothetical protein
VLDMPFVVNVQFAQQCLAHGLLQSPQQPLRQFIDGPLPAGAKPAIAGVSGRKGKEAGRVIGAQQVVVEGIGAWQVVLKTMASSAGAERPPAHE